MVEPIVSHLLERFDDDVTHYAVAVAAEDTQPARQAVTGQEAPATGHGELTSSRLVPLARPRAECPRFRSFGLQSAVSVQGIDIDRRTRRSDGKRGGVAADVRDEGDSP